MKIKEFGTYYVIRVTMVVNEGDRETSGYINFETKEAADKYYKEHVHEYDGVWRKINKPVKRTIRVRFED